MMALHPDFLRQPIAHRGLHRPGLPENSMAAFRAAIANGYAIECDIQRAMDSTPMVFHDYELKRLTHETNGTVAASTPQHLARLRLLGTDEPIPTLAQMLAEVAGRVPLLIEIKDQDGAMGPDIGPVEAAVARALAGYAGEVAVMSFNPHSVARMAELAPDLPRGLVTSAYYPHDWPLPAEVRDRLREIPDFARSGASFISHEVEDLHRARVRELHAAGVPVLCWTVTSPLAEAAARRLADNITFEGYLAALA